MITVHTMITIMLPTKAGRPLPHSLGGTSASCTFQKTVAKCAIMSATVGSNSSPVSSSMPPCSCSASRKRSIQSPLPSSALRISRRRRAMRRASLALKVASSTTVMAQTDILSETPALLTVCSSSRNDFSGLVVEGELSTHTSTTFHVSNGPKTTGTSRSATKSPAAALASASTVLTLATRVPSHPSGRSTTRRSLSTAQLQKAVCVLNFATPLFVPRTPSSAPTMSTMVRALPPSCAGKVPCVVTSMSARPNARECSTTPPSICTCTRADTSPAGMSTSPESGFTPSASPPARTTQRTVTCCSSTPERHTTAVASVVPCAMS
mmetsp:Transcript_3057/g.7496  ORF Transcript_3057/g.7496 Transcript_3057/m.7496 type:complete len:323 (-) Transcript_3057:1422-2390(-)